MNSKLFKCCAVPQCDNTTLKTPNMVFVYVPHIKKIRNKWLNLARRDPKSVLLNKSIYFCEDHFDLPNDMENYMQYHVMGAVTKVRMKSGCVPSKFNCQSDREDRISDTSETCLDPDIKSEPIDEQYETPELDDDMDLEDVKIEVEEHTVASKLSEDVSVFMPCTRQILPKINMFSIVEYIVQNESYKDIDYKNLKTDIDINAEDTIGNVQIHKIDDRVTLQGTVAFDRDTAYCCLIKYDLYTRTINYTNCQCQLLACQHVLAFLMWLHRRSEEQLDNNMSFCLEPLVQQTTFLKAKDIVNDSDTDTLSDDLEIPENMEQIQQNIVDEFVNTCKELKMYNSPLYRYLNPNLELSLNRMQASWRETAEAQAEGPDHFIRYCSERMAGREADLRELETCEDNKLRRELQYGRLEGRHVFVVGSSMDSERTLTLEEMGLSDILHNSDIPAHDEFTEKMKTALEKQLDIKINKCGIILSKEYPIYCAVPYGLTDSHVIDMVCIEDEEDTSKYMEDYKLKLNIQFMLQFNMLLTKKKKSYFFIGYQKEGITKQIFILELKFNKKYCNTFLKRGVRFWKDNVFQIISPT